MARPRKHQPVKKKCVQCGKQWLAETVYAIEKQITCGLECRNAYTSAERTHKVLWTCRCGQTRMLTPYWSSVRKHCSNECRAAHNPNDGDLNPAWTGGGPTFWKQKARERDDFTCRFPGCGLRDEGKRTHAHHKIPSAVGGSDDLDNLVTLCATHHKQLEACVLSTLMSKHPALVLAASVEAFADLLPCPEVPK